MDACGHRGYWVNERVNKNHEDLSLEILTGVCKQIGTVYDMYKLNKYASIKVHPAVKWLELICVNILPESNANTTCRIKQSRQYSLASNPRPLVHLFEE